MGLGVDLQLRRRPRGLRREEVPAQGPAAQADARAAARAHARGARPEDAEAAQAGAELPAAKVRRPGGVVAWVK